MKLRGIIVGDVRKVTTTGSRRHIKLALQPSKAKLIPHNVVARILPKTLFGQKFVDLVVPPDASHGLACAQGDVIPEDRSKNAIEAETVLNNMLPVLRTVAPGEAQRDADRARQRAGGPRQRAGRQPLAPDTYLRTFNQHLPALHHRHLRARQRRRHLRPGRP